MQKSSAHKNDFLRIEVACQYRLNQSKTCPAIIGNCSHFKGADLKNVIRQVLICCHFVTRGTAAMTSETVE
ncbi:MAG: hypothetical protein KDA84_02715 [Planctomycetaceae bacterium]|nr:hypothetical protein [Planctomycetaceae bacterium]